MPWFHFCLMKTGFPFFGVDHQLVGQLCTNSKSDRSLLSCLKVTQCSTSEIGDAPLYHSWSLLMAVMTTGPLPVPSTCKSGSPPIIGTCPGRWKQSFRLLFMVFCVVLSCHLTSSKSAWKSTPKCTWTCWWVWWSPIAIMWPVADPGCGSRTWHRSTSPKRPRLGFRRSATTLYPSPTGFPPPSTWTRWTTSFGHTSRRSPTWHPTTPKPAWSPPSAEYSPSSRSWKRHALSSGSVSRWWLRLKAATLNRCQLYYIIKLPELIFFNKTFKIKL